MWNSKELEFYDRHNKQRPSHIQHGVSPDNINEHMRKLQPRSWKLHGNVLTGMTDMGPLVQTIPTDYILTGTDDEGLPVFTKVKLQ